MNKQTLSSLQKHYRIRAYAYNDISTNVVFTSIGLKRLSTYIFSIEYLAVKSAPNIES